MNKFWLFISAILLTAALMCFLFLVADTGSAGPEPYPGYPGPGIWLFATYTPVPVNGETVFLPYIVRWPDSYPVVPSKTPEPLPTPSKTPYPVGPSPTPTWTTTAGTVTPTKTPVPVG